MSRVLNELVDKGLGNPRSRGRAYQVRRKGGIEGMLGDLLAGAGPAHRRGKSSGMINPATIAMAGSAAKMLFGSKKRYKRKKYKGAFGGGNMGKLVKGGAMGLLAYMAWKAWNSRNAGQTAASAQHAEPTPAEIDAMTSEGTQRLVLRAMVAAAKADGHVDQDEMGRIADQLDQSGAAVEERKLVLEEMTRDTTPEDLAREARDPRVAAQVYAASLLAAPPDTEAERRYLERLARALGLDRATVESLHALADG